MSEDVSSYEAIAINSDAGSQPVAGRIFPTHFTLRFEAPDIEIALTADDTTVSIGEDEDERLYFREAGKPEWTLATEDHEILHHRLFAKNNHLRRQIQTIFGRKASHKALIITVCALICFTMIGFAVSWGLDQVVRGAAAQVSPEMEKSFGDKEYEEIKTKISLSQDPRLIKQLDDIYTRLRIGLPDTNLQVQFHIIEMPIPNAGSIPGHVFVTRGLFDLLDTPEQMAGVLAHEVGHITHKHIFRRLVSASAPAYALKTMFRNSRGTMASLARSSQFVMGQSFSRDYEREADASGWDYLVAADIDPHGFIESLQRLQNFENKYPHAPGVFSDHPPTADRIMRLESNWKKLPKKSGFIEFPDNNAGARL